MFSSKQTHKFDYFICYHLESGRHVISQGLSLGKGKSLGTRLVYSLKWRMLTMDIHRRLLSSVDCTCSNGVFKHSCCC